MTDQTLDHVILRCRGCQAAYPAALEYACSRCLGPLDPEYDAEYDVTDERLVGAHALPADDEDEMIDEIGAVDGDSHAMSGEDER